MTRILMCTLGCEPGPVGGAERQAWRQAVELIARGHEVTIVCPWTPGTRSGRRSGIRIRRLPQLPLRSSLRTLTYAPFLFAYLLVRGRRADLLHVHLANLQADVVALAARFIRRPLYVKVATGGPRGDVQRLAPIAPFTRRIGLMWASRVQAISEEIAADLVAIDVPSERIVRVPNGIDTDVITPADPATRGELRQRLGLPHDGVIVLFLGRFAGYKGIADLVAAWPSIGDRALLLLVGEPALDDPVAVPTDAPAIMVRTWTLDVASYLRAVDVLVQPSHADGMSNTVLEAMSAGLAIVATDVGAAPEMLGDGTGVIVPSQRPDALARALATVVDDPLLREALGHRARTAVVERYGIRPVVDGIEAAYRAMLAEHPA